MARRAKNCFPQREAAVALFLISITRGTRTAFFDYDHDGDLDLFVCNYVQWSHETDLQVDYRLPEIGRAYGPPMSFAGTFPILYRNDGGKFTDVSASAGIQIKNKATGLPLAKSLGVSRI